jgi:hypothetical protein
MNTPVRIRVHFSLYLPEGTPDADVDAWLRAQLGETTALLNHDNALRTQTLARTAIPTDIDWIEV